MDEKLPLATNQDLLSRIREIYASVFQDLPDIAWKRSRTA